MQLLHLIGGVHGLLLAGISWRSASRLTGGVAARLCAWFLLVWSNLAFTALLLAAFTRLNSTPLYFTVSLAGAAALEAMLAWRKTSALPSLVADTPDRPDRIDMSVRRMLGITLLLAGLGSALICYFYVPNNWDSLTYRFSRAFFYLGHGDLLHTGNPLDPRLQYYPLNGVLFYLFFAVYQMPAIWFYAVTAFAWIFAGLGTFYVARCLGASRTGAWVAAWICLLSPNVLAQAAATNDEVLAAVPLLLALGFLLEWFAVPKVRYALLAGLGLGLGMGTKLHWGFYGIAVLATAVWVVVRAAMNAGFRTQVMRRLPAALAAGALAAPLAVAFGVANYISAHKLTDQAFNDQVLNRPFRLSLASEKIRINTANLFVSPIPDLLPPVNREERKNTYTAFNRFFIRCCFSDLVETTKRSPEGYLFEGPADPEGAAPNEYSVWLGFAPHLMLLACLASVFTRGMPRASLVLIAAFFCWFVTYSVSSHYIPTASVYYSYPAVLALPALGPAWDFARSSHRWGRVVLTGFLLVFATHILLGANLLAFGGLRNLQFAWRRTPAPEMHPVAPSVASAIREARRIYIPYTHWEVLYWNFMRFNPGAKYFTGVDLRMPSPDTMMLLPVAREGGSDLFPARLPNASPTGLIYIGDAGGQPIFAQGGGVENNRPGRARYMLLPIWWGSDAAGRINSATLRVSRPSQNVACCVGVEPESEIEYRYELKSSAGGPRFTRDWLRVGAPDSGVPANGHDSYDTFLVETRHRQRPDDVARTERRLSPVPYNLSGESR